MFPPEQARDAAQGLLPGLLRRRRAILAGRRVAAAFGLQRLPYLEWAALGPKTEVAVIPHPSGVCRWWNEPGNVEAAARFLRDARA